MTFFESGRYRLESEWTVLCGDSREKLAECRVRSSLEIEVPEGTYDAPAGVEVHEK